MKIENYTAAGYCVAELEEPDSVASDPWGIEWYPDIADWCERTFGHQDLWGEEPVTGWKRMRTKYCFVEKDKLTLFLIRWL